MVAPTDTAACRYIWLAGTVTLFAPSISSLAQVILVCSVNYGALVHLGLNHVVASACWYTSLETLNR